MVNWRRAGCCGRSRCTSAILIRRKPPTGARCAASTWVSAVRCSVHRKVCWCTPTRVNYCCWRSATAESADPVTLNGALAPFLIEFEVTRMVPVIELVGRPNVGKSTLFNRLTKTRDALVAEIAGLTRDRKYGEGKVGDHPFIVIDTGGI